MPLTLNTSPVNGAGETEDVRIIVPDADFVEQAMSGAFDDCLLIAITATGKAKFVPSRESKDGKTTKATFVVAEVGSGWAGERIAPQQTEGDVAGLPMSLKLSLTAAPPNRKATTIDEALNRKVDLQIVENTEQKAAKAA